MCQMIVILSAVFVSVHLRVLYARRALPKYGKTWTCIVCHSLCAFFYYCLVIFRLFSVKWHPRIGTRKKMVYTTRMLFISNCWCFICYLFISFDLLRFFFAYFLSFFRECNRGVLKHDWIYLVGFFYFAGDAEWMIA